MTRRDAKTWALLAVMLLWPSASGSTAERSATDSSSVRFRRVLVPAEKLDQFISGYIPKNASDFERSVHLAQSADSLPSAVQVDQATYTARYEDGQLIDGVANLRLSVDSERIPAELPFDVNGLAITRPRWFQGEEVQPAVIGASPQGELRLLLETEASHLQFFWTSRGKANSSGVVFELTLPPSTLSRLDIQLPSNLIPHVDRGIASMRSSEHSAPEASHALWRIEFGSQRQLRLWIAPRSSPESHTTYKYLRQSSSYTLSLDGLVLKTTITIDARDEPLTRVRCLVGSDLEITNVSHAEAPLRWAIVDEQSIEVELPRQMSGGEASFQVTAYARAPVRKLWRLPRLRPDDVRWLQEDAQVIVLRPLVLSDMQTQGCSPKGVAPLAAPRVGEAYRFQYAAADAAISVTLQPLDRTVEFEVGHLLQLEASSARATVSAQIQPSESDVFAVAAEVGKDWIIDSVDAGRARIIDDWDLVGRRLHIGFRVAATRDQPISLTIRAHRTISLLNRAALLKELRPIRFIDRTSVNGWMMIRAEPSYQLQIQRSGLGHWQRFDEVPARIADALNATEDELLLRLDRQANEVLVGVKKSPPITVSSSVDVSVSETTVTESYTLRVDPVANRLGRVTVEFAAQRDSDIDWSVDHEPTGLSAERTTNQPSAAEWHRDVWELALTPAREEPFVIHAKRSFPTREEIDVALVSVRDASKQTGEVCILGEGGATVRINNLSGLKEIPTASRKANPYATILAAFHFSEKDALSNRCLTLTAVDDTNHAPAWVWNCEIRSHYAPGGRVRNRVTFHLQNNGARSCEIDLGDRCMLHRVEVNGKEIPARTGWRTSTTVPLPSEDRFPTVALEFLQRKQARTGWISWADSMHVDVPEINIPVLQQTWELWLPPGVAAAGQSSGWMPRLFGRLARSDREIFNPFAKTDWQGLVSATPEEPLTSASTWEHQENAPAAARYGDDLAIMLSRAGWSMHRQSVAGSHASLRVYQRDAVVAIAAGIFVSAIPLSWWVSARCGGKRLLLMAGMAFVSALLLPQPGASLAMSFAWGVVVCALLRLSTRAGDSSTSHSPNSLIAPARGVTTTLVWLASLGLSSLVVSATANAGEPPGNAVDSPFTIGVHDVLIPVDANQRPTGPAVYVKPPLVHALQQVEQAHRPPTSDWLLESARYRAAIPRSQDLGSPTVTTAFRFRTRRPDTVLLLPFQASSVQVDENATKLDGEAVTADWLASRVGCQIVVQQPGTHRLEMKLTPVRHPVSHQNGFRFGIPRVPDSRLEVIVPREIVDVEVPMAEGRLETDLERGTMSAELGATDQLEVLWSNRQTDPSEIESRQLVWLEVHQNAVHVNVKFKLPRMEKPLRVIVDRRLRLMPTPDGTVSDTAATDGDSRIVEIAPNPDGTPPEAHFFMTETPPIGELRLPRIELLHARPKIWVALSVDSRFVYEFPEPRGEPAVAADFAAAWGNDTEPPDAVTVLPDPCADWIVAVRPQKAAMRINSDTAYYLRRNRPTFRFEANIDAGYHSALSLRLLVSDPLEVKQVTLFQDGAVRAVRWQRDFQGDVGIFFTSLLSGQFQLIVHGDLLVPLNSADCPVPRLRIADTTATVERVRVYRTPETIVSVVGADGYTPSDSSARSGETDVAMPRADRLVGAWERRTDAADDAAVRIRVEPNEPVVSGHLVTKLVPGRDAWSVDVDGQFTISQGKLDVIRFEISAELASEVTSSGVRLEVENSPRPEHRTLVFWLPESESRKRRMTFRLRLPMPDQDRVSVPQVRLLDFESSVSHTLLLPTRRTDGSADRRGASPQFAWSTPQLVRLPASSIPAGTSADDYEAYRVPPGEFQARLAPVAATNDVPRVRLLDVQAVWNREREMVGLATFDVEPAAKLASCLLELPSNCRLIQAMAAGARTTAQQTPTGMWQLHLGTDSWPQRIHIVYVGECDITSNGQVTLSAPRMAIDPGTNPSKQKTANRLQIGQTLWSIHGPFDAGEGIVQSDAVPLTAQERDIRRLSATIGLLADAIPITRDNPREEILGWFPLWAERVEAIRQRIRGGESKSGNPQQPDTVQQLESKYLNTATTLGVREIAGKTRPADDDVAFCRALELEQRKTMYFASNGTDDGHTIPEYSLRSRLHRCPVAAIDCSIDSGSDRVLGILPFGLALRGRRGQNLASSVGFLPRVGLVALPHPEFSWLTNLPSEHSNASSADARLIFLDRSSDPTPHQVNDFVL